MNKKKFAKFLSNCGIESNTENFTDNDLDELSKMINGNFMAGKDAVDKLREINTYNPNNDLDKMGFKKRDRHHLSIESFRDETAKDFCIGHAIASTNVQSPDGIKARIEAGKNYCMTWPGYQAANGQKVIFRPATDKFNEKYKPYRGENLDYKTLFVWREGGIGDLLFIRPILVHLKKKYKCRIIFSTKTSYFPMMDLWADAIDELVPMPFPVADTLDISDYHVTFSGLIENCKDAELVDVHDLFAKYMFLDPDEVEWTVPMPTISTNSFFLTKPRNYAVVQATSSSPIRTPRLNTIVHAINAITRNGINVFVADSPYKSKAVDDLISVCESPEMVTNFAVFSESIQDVVKLIDGARFVVAPDSSMVHIAGMQGVPSVAIYGPFPAFCRVTRYKNCKSIEPPESTVCEYGGKHCFTHSHLRCEMREVCWDTIDNDELTKLINETIGEQACS